MLSFSYLLQSQRPRSIRKAAGAASKKLRVVDESDEESSGSDAEGEEGSSDGSGSEGEGEAASEIEEASSSDGGSDYMPSD